METGQHPSLGLEAEDEFSVFQIVNPLLIHWRLVVVLPVILALLVGVLVFTKQRMYGASASFFPQEAESSRLGGAAALAQQFGVDIATKTSTQSPQFYVDLLQSRALLREVVASKYNVLGPDSSTQSLTLSEFYHRRDGSPRPWLQTVDIVRQQVTPSIARQTGVVRFTVASPQPALSEQIAQRLLDLVNEFNLELNKKRAEQENRFVGDRLAEAQTKLLEAESALQTFQRQNRQFENSPELRFENDRLQRQVNARQEVYTSLLRSQEQTRIDAMRDTPLIAVIDHPAGTAEPQPRGTVSKALLGFVLGLGLAIGIAFVTESARRGKQSAEGERRAFQALAKQAWLDARRPSRWFRRANVPPAGASGLTTS